MLLTIEKVLILKSIDIFLHTPDHFLVNIADLLEVLEIGENEVIFEKGEMGRSLYIIAAGEVKVHNAEKVFKTLKAGSFFGEWAALDPEPRTATVTALVPTKLFQLERHALFDLMSTDIELVEGIITALVKSLRAAANN